tara:strand:+ start:288 stop:638 length:351 start_codon:yes stop_codon:yes gene_type:complete
MECIIKESTKRKKQLSKKNTSLHRKRFMKRVKLFLGCQLCGYKKHACALHFDHIDPNTKFKIISRMNNYSMEALKNEMRKCRVLCANCHAAHTEYQRQNKIVTSGPRKNAEDKPNS